MYRTALAVALIASIGCGDDADKRPQNKRYAPIRSAPGSMDAATAAETDEAPAAVFSATDLNGCVRGNTASCTAVREAVENSLQDLGAEDHFNVAHIYYRGLGGDQDVLRARDHYEKSCSGGYGVGCTMLGVLYEKGDTGGPPDTKTAAVYFGRACEAGDGKGCFLHARALETGTAGATKQDRAREQYKKACEANIAEGCNNLGIMMRDAEGGEADPAGARRVFAQACDANYALSCANLGLMLANGVGGQADAPKSKELFAKACKLGHQQACGPAGLDAGPPAIDAAAP